MAAVYQSVFGGDVYPSLEEKVANLLFNEIDRSGLTKLKVKDASCLKGKKMGIRKCFLQGRD